MPLLPARPVGPIHPARALFFLTIAAAVLAVDLPAAPSAREKAEVELRRLHADAREAHLRTDVARLLADRGKEFLAVSRGRIDRIGRDDEKAHFEKYFTGAKYFEWDDLEPPVVRVSQDASLGWIITRVKVRRTQKDAAGREQEQKFVYAGVMLYERQGGRWVRTGNVSTFE